jgi:hypothetical protein
MHLWQSASGAIDAINRGALEVQPGIALVYSARTRTNWLIYRDDKEAEARKLAMEYRAPTRDIERGVAAVAEAALTESDNMEKPSAPKYAHLLADSGTEHIRLVSLGCMCGSKVSFQQLGRGAETLPFDWVRSRLKGILHLMRSDFQGFFSYNTYLPNCVGPLSMYRSPHVSFWHDNPDDPGMRERYERRIERFHNIDARKQPVLFVRAVASTNEFREGLLEELLEELKERFGKKVFLLLIVDYQTKVQGPAFVKNVKGNLLVYFHKEEDRNAAGLAQMAPYMKPVVDGLLWAKGEKMKHAKEFASMSDVASAVDPTHWGYTARSDVRAFEGC